MKFLAIDLGASSGRCIVGEIEAGQIGLSEVHRFANNFHERDGEKHWDLGKLVGEVRTGIANAGDIDGMAVDTWGVDYGLIDANGELLDEPFAYRDARTERSLPEVYQRLPKDRLYEITGLQEMPFNTVFQVMADLLDNPARLERAERLLFTPDLIAYLLSGTAFTEYTIASTSALLDARTRDWSDEVIETLGLPRRIFGQITPPGHQRGEVDGVPVYTTGSHDTASAVAAVPAVDDGPWAFLSSGTWSLIGAELAEPVLTPAARRADFTNEGGVAGRIRFLKNVNGMWLLQECRRIWQQQGQEFSFAEMAAAAEESGCRSIFDPNLPQFMAPENMVETIAEACRAGNQQEPQSVGDYARCCYESLAQAYRRELAKLEAVTGQQYRRLHVVGGGCQADLLNRLTAKALGIPVIAGPVEATAIGNICVQAMANGLFSDLAAVRRAIAEAFPVTVYEP